MFVRVLSIAALCVVLSLAGCGSNTSAVIGVNPVPSNLNGNWLLVGSLPFAGTSGTPANSNFGVAGTFSVIGSNVEAALSDNIPCGAFTGSGTAGVIQGTIASDGTVSMQTSTVLTPLATMKLTGSVPANGASSWSGHLTFTRPGGTCPVAQDLNFTAVRIADVTGTYAATAPITLTNGLSFPGTQNATFSITLHQGAVLAGTSTQEPEVLSGTISVQGVSCFSSGTIAATSGVLGSEFELQITMNDGSTANLLGQILDPLSARLSVNGVFGSGSACGSFFTPPFTVVRQ